MAEAIVERVSATFSTAAMRIFGGCWVSLRAPEIARSAFRRVSMQEGWHVIDCGCGPMGGLAVMAEMVARPGGWLASTSASRRLQRARSVVAALQLGNVELLFW